MSPAALSRALHLLLTRPDLVVVALAALLAFGGTLAYDFVWDDTLLVQRGISSTTGGRSPLPSAPTSGGDPGDEPLLPAPCHAELLPDLQAWGLNPLGFHLTNILAHLATALAVLALARRITGSEIAATAAGLLFALHPLHSESVAFVSGRSDVLATLLFVLALLGYAHWRDTARHRALAASLLTFFLALTAKEEAVTLPLALALYDWARPGAAGQRRSIKRALGRYLPYGAVIGLYAALRLAAMGGLLDLKGVVWADPITRILTGLDIIARYAAGSLALPRQCLLSNRVRHATAWRRVVAPCFSRPRSATALAAMFPSARLRSAVVLGDLIPFTGVNFLAPSAPIMAERFLYLPSVGVCLLLDRRRTPPR
jgi:hypothetical protein